MTVEICHLQFVHNDLREYDSDEDGNDDGNDLPSVTLFGDDGGDDHPLTIAERNAAMVEMVENADMHHDLQKNLTHHLYNVYRNGKKM